MVARNVNLDVNVFASLEGAVLNQMNNSGLMIVIADDEAPIRLVVGEKLRSAGFNVIEAPDGEEALDAVKQHKPVCIVTDLQMPYMNGLELSMAVKADRSVSATPVLLLTARGHVLSDDMLSKTNIIKVMSKPFGVRELLAFVETTLVPAGLKARELEAVAPVRSAA